MSLFNDFRNMYPKADISHFTFVPDSYGGYIKWQVDGTTIMSNDDPTGKTWIDDISPGLKRILWKDLGLASNELSSFPNSLTLTNLSYPIPAIDFDDFSTNITKMLTSLDIYVSNTKKFTAKMRNIFTSQVVTFKFGKQSRKWLNAPDMNYWPQQLNFAVWCATSGCGISPFESLNYPKVVNSFIKFHIYFTIRRILYELSLPLPDEQPFLINNNPYSKVAYQRLCAEFEIANNSDFRGAGRPLADFRWKGGRNGGLGDIFLDYGEGYHGKGGGYQNVHIVRNYDIEADRWPGEGNKFADEGGKKEKGNLISFIRNDDFADFKYAWFIPTSGHGLTKAGLGRLNRSAEAFVYCILGAQVNTRNSIYGNGGGAIETQQEFLALFESSVIENDISSSIQRYQLAVQEAKLRLDLAIAPGVWLMPSNMIINTESVTGFNNKLMKASNDMNFGVNNSLNTEAKQVGISHNLGSSKLKLIEDQYRQSRKLPHIPFEVKTETNKNPQEPKTSTKTDSMKQENNIDSTQHEKNILAFIIVAGGLAWYLFR